MFYPFFLYEEGIHAHQSGPHQFCRANQQALKNPPRLYQMGLSAHYAR